MTESTPAGQREPKTPIPRRIVLVDRQLQFRAAAMVTGLVALLLVFVNVALFAMRRSQTELLVSTAPDLREILESGNIRLATFAIVLSVVVLVFVWFGTILATHRTAGAIVGLRRRLESVRDGNFHTVLRLRPNDNLRSLEPPFNQMASRRCAIGRRWSRLASTGARPAERPGGLPSPVRCDVIRDRRRIRGAHTARCSTLTS